MKTLPTPVLSTGIYYYKRQLWTYCFGVHNLATGEVTMYMWNESIASRGAQEVGSCLLHYIKNYLKTKHLIMYSDQCGGQNRNIKLALLCNYIVDRNDFVVEKLDHKLLVSGHSYLPCDQDFGIIEKNKKFHQNIFVPKDWKGVVTTARKKKPFQVVEIQSQDFISTQALEKNITNRKIATDGRKVEWIKMQWMQLRRAIYNHLQIFKQP